MLLAYVSCLLISVHYNIKIPDIGTGCLYIECVITPVMFIAQNMVGQHKTNATICSKEYFVALKTWFEVKH